LDSAAPEKVIDGEADGRGVHATVARETVEKRNGKSKSSCKLLPCSTNGYLHNVFVSRTESSKTSAKEIKEDERKGRIFDIHTLQRL